MKKIIVIGCPGSWKSTFARKLRDKTGIRLYYLDMIWHRPDQTTVPRDEFDLKLKEILEKDSWIIDGNYMRTMEMRLSECDTVFMFDIPREDCLNGALSRVGIKREDMPWTETELDGDFLKLILDFDKEQRPKIYGYLDRIKQEKKVIIFNSRAEADGFIDSLM